MTGISRMVYAEALKQRNKSKYTDLKVTDSRPNMQLHRQCEIKAVDLNHYMSTLNRSQLGD